MSIRNELNFLEVRHRNLMSYVKDKDPNDPEVIAEIQVRVDALRRQLNNLANDVDLTMAGLIRAGRAK